MAGVINFERCSKCLGGRIFVLCLDKSVEIYSHGCGYLLCKLYWHTRRPKSLDNFAGRYLGDVDEINEVLAKCRPDPSHHCYCEYFIEEINGVDVV